MDKFGEVYGALNAAQKEAVDTIDGPLLVIAGPGTGKTQLLSARVANILQKTDTPAHNILCLTFTENGAENMRQRLSRFIGQTAYDVTISTYHAFGGDLIRRFPEYFAETRLQNPIDELGKRQIIADIVDQMSYTNPLKQTRHHLGDLISTISETKRALLTSQDLKLIAAENQRFLQQAGREIRDIFKHFTRMPAIKNALPLFENTLEAMNQHMPETPVNTQFGSLAATAALALKTALDDATTSNKTTPLTNWKGKWLAKDDDNRFTLAGELESKRLQALADVLDQYQAALQARGLYDFDDMIVRATEILEDNDDLRFTLQEQYLYILLDEFQDTNAAQLKLVELLTNNPANEGRPNVMAVGDDDQAIYAFQGAQYSNMLDFYHMYQDVRVINLTENYRSHPDILLTAANVANQIEARLHEYFEDSSKNLTAASSQSSKHADIDRCEFLSDIAQADWIAKRVKKLINNGTPPREIAILAPRHRQLEPLIPYLNALNIPVRYEKRENILDAPVVKQLLTMSRLVLALHNRDEAVADHLWPQVLSYDFWRLPISRIWEASWQVADAARHTDANTWSKVLLADGKEFRIPALLFHALAAKADDETCETMLDYLIGSIATDTNEPDLPAVYSPLREYYTNEHVRGDQPELFYETLTHLTVLRARLCEHQNTSEATLKLQDLIDLVDMYQAADERMVNTSPYNQQTNAVQVMTVFKAKGLEFEHVFLPSCQDDVWGSAASGQSNRLTLPGNLMPIRHTGATDDERLRILFVAVTRAKLGLHLSSVSQNYNGKTTKRLRYLDEREQEDRSFKDLILPEHAQAVESSDTQPPAIELLELDWRRRHTCQQQASLKALLENRLKNYQLSPTHLNTFLDLQYGGPVRFFFTTILRFPEAPTVDSQFGSAIHETMEWLQQAVSEQGAMPSINDALTHFASRIKNKNLASSRLAIELERGEASLVAFLSTRGSTFTPTDRAEVSFKHENVFIGSAHLAGKIDRLEIDDRNKTIHVIDYKTGKSFSRWTSDAKLHHYRRQLYCYKLLVEHSRTFASYKVVGGRLEFVEPDKNNRINTLELIFSDDELKHTEQLLQAMWQHVHRLDFPSVQSYDASLTGIRSFEQDLMNSFQNPLSR